MIMTRTQINNNEEEGRGEGEERVLCHSLQYIQKVRLQKRIP